MDIITTCFCLTFIQVTSGKVDVLFLVFSYVLYIGNPLAAPKNCGQSTAPNQEFYSLNILDNNRLGYN